MTDKFKILQYNLQWQKIKKPKKGDESINDLINNLNVAIKHGCDFMCLQEFVFIDNIERQNSTSTAILFTNKFSELCHSNGYGAKWGYSLFSHVQDYALGKTMVCTAYKTTLYTHLQTIASHIKIKAIDGDLRYTYHGESVQIKKGRPLALTLLKEKSSEKIILIINVHNGHSTDMGSLTEIISDISRKNPCLYKPDYVLMSGDFNLDTFESRRTSIRLHYSDKSMTIYLNASVQREGTAMATCCWDYDNPRHTRPPRYYRNYDNVFSSYGSPQFAIPKLYSSNVITTASDHKPVFVTVRN